MTTADAPQSKDKLAILTRVPLFASCTEEQLRLVAERTRLLEYKKGETVYREGDVADAFYIVASGRLRVLSMVEAKEQVYAVLHNGDTFGEISLLTGESHSATVEALNDTLIFHLAKRDFDELINRIPSLVLYLSRLLSKRLRNKDQPGLASEATVIALHSAVPGVGRTSFTMALAAELHRETRQAAVVVDFTTPEGEMNRAFGMPRYTKGRPIVIQGFWSEESFQHDVLEHPLGFQFLYAAHVSAQQETEEQLIAPLIGGLTTRYRYILLDLPTRLDAAVLKALTQADLIYIVSDESQPHLARTKALVQQVREAVSHFDQRMKLVLNLMGRAEERRTPQEAAKFLGLPVSYVLPHLESAAGALTPQELIQRLEGGTVPYVRAVRRIARELGGLLVGLALGSGAALGLAHIGILKVIEQEHIPIDLVAGSSIGALISALWASGKSVAELEEITKRFEEPWKIRALFLDFGIPLFSAAIGLAAGALVGAFAGFWTGLLFGFLVTIAVGLVFGPLVGGPLLGDRVMQFLVQELGEKTFDETWVPLKIIAANPWVREEIVFESGRLADAVRASIAIPGIFKPTRWMGRVCLDGGIVNPVPVSVLRQAGAKRVIAVNVFPTTPELATYIQESIQRRAERDAKLAS